MLSVVMLSVIMLSVVMLNVTNKPFMLSVIMLSVNMLSAVVPKWQLDSNSLLSSRVLYQLHYRY
jgi:hypothetical protein